MLKNILPWDSAATPKAEKQNPFESISKLSAVLPVSSAIPPAASTSTISNGSTRPAGAAMTSSFLKNGSSGNLDSGSGSNHANSTSSGSSGSSSSSPKGLVSIKLIGVRNFSLPPGSTPYFLVIFEGNEFIGRDSSFENQLSLTKKDTVTFDVTREDSNILVMLYDRSPDLSDDGEQKDYKGEGFLGSRTIQIKLTEGHFVDQWFAMSATGSQSADEGTSPENSHVAAPGEGEIRIQIGYERAKSRRNLTPRDFDFLRLVGRGTFGRVFQVRKKDSNRIYAMKVLSKKEIVAKKEVAHTIGERKILQRSLECPFLVGLKFSFQTDTDLYFVTDYKSGGEMFYHLQREGRFTEDRARFYIAELVLALEHLHKFDIVYRDLKPENILLDATGHIALCDFGLSKPDLAGDELTNTFCGTTEYLAPEVLLDDHGYSKLVDFWSLGVLLFEMCCGWSPFYAEDTQQMYKNICFGKIRFPKNVIGDDGKQFVKGLLNRNPKHRLGATRDTEELKEHPFFSKIDWKALAAKEIQPPFKPTVESDESVANFDTEFTASDIRETLPPEAQAEAYLHNNFLNAHGMSSSKTVMGQDGNSLATPLANATGTNLAGVAGALISGSPIKGDAPIPIVSSGSRGARFAAGSPLTSSVQENFRGFTYSGESVINQTMASINSGQPAPDLAMVETVESDERPFDGFRNRFGEADSMDQQDLETPLAGVGRSASRRDPPVKNALDMMEL